MRPKDFETLLVSLRACAGARTWAAGKSLKEVWETCDRADWLLWLAGKMADKKGWPTLEDVRKARYAATDAYAAALAAHATYAADAATYARGKAMKEMADVVRKTLSVPS